jgi:hypothetical protein
MFLWTKKPFLKSYFMEKQGWRRSYYEPSQVMPFMGYFLKRVKIWQLNGVDSSTFRFFHIWLWDNVYKIVAHRTLSENVMPVEGDIT